MISEELKSIIESLQPKDEMYFLEGATEGQIEKFEKENGIKLPKKYKEWLRFSDGGECFVPGGVQFYGVAHKPLLDVNEDDRPNDSYLVIGTLATGDPILCEKEGEKISIYNHEEGIIESDVIYEDFFALLKDLPAILGIEE